MQAYALSVDPVTRWSALWPGYPMPAPAKCNQQRSIGDINRHTGSVFTPRLLSGPRYDQSWGGIVFGLPIRGNGADRMTTNPMSFRSEGGCAGGGRHWVSLTIVPVVCHPSLLFQGACRFPQAVTSPLRVFEALLDLDTLVGLDGLSHHNRVAHGRIKGPMAPSLMVVHILSNDFPVFQPENWFAQNIIGVPEPI